MRYAGVEDCCVYVSGVNSACTRRACGCTLQPYLTLHFFFFGFFLLLVPAIFSVIIFASRWFAGWRLSVLCKWLRESYAYLSCGATYDLDTQQPHNQFNFLCQVGTYPHQPSSAMEALAQRQVCSALSLVDPSIVDPHAQDFTDQVRNFYLFASSQSAIRPLTPREVS